MTSAEVSVRELRQNLSVYLRRVQDGDTLAVTSRGERVAMLSPVGGGSRIDRLIAEGRVAPPAVAGEEHRLPAPAPPEGGAQARPLTDVLLAEREDDAR